MFDTFRRTAFAVLIILLGPILIFSVYEIGSMKSKEKMIESIYMNQLDAILFSVNQYSDDVLSSWASKMDVYNVALDSISHSEQLNTIIAELPGIISISRYDMNLNLLGVAYDSLIPLTTNADVDKTMLDNDTLFTRLKSYYRGGYRKIVPVNLPERNRQLVVFLGRYNDTLVINALMLDPEKFISTILDPKIQAISRNNFYISAYNSNSHTAFYNSDKHHEPGKFAHRNNFWILPNYALGIEMKDQTISQLAQSRTNKDILAVAIIDLLLLAGVFIILRNVRKQVELAKLKSDFVSNVSHEIRTPLALISMYIETLDMGRVSSAEKIKEYYKVIMSETQRLSSIVNKILNFSRIESGKRIYNFGLVNVNDVLRNVSSIFQLILEKNEFDFKVICAENLPALTADYEAVTDALVNLMDNAIKYSSENKSITITVFEKENWLVFSVADKGIGISDRERKHIFDKFYRVTEKDLALKAKGSGLGLAIVKHILDAHKGKIVVNSELFKGTEFSLYFPLLLKNKYQ